MLDALELYYTVEKKKPAKYNEKQRELLTNIYYRFSTEFLTRLMKEITQMHEARFRTLPDAAVFSRAMQAMGDPRTYQVEQKALPMPEFDMGTYLDENTRAIEEGAKKELDRVRGKRHRTAPEEWWLKCVDFGGWLPMPKDWEVGNQFPPREVLTRVASDKRIGSLLRHNERDEVPSRG
jgi:hypothetical protein